MNIEVIGIDHIYIAVSDLVLSEAFYDKVMPVIGFKKNCFENEGERHVQYFNRHFGYVLRQGHSRRTHDPLAPGLHHLCFRVEDLAALQRAARDLSELGVTCSQPEHYPEYAPDYYAVFFCDPDGIKLELTNYREERRKRYADWPNVS